MCSPTPSCRGENCMRKLFQRRFRENYFCSPTQFSTRACAVWFAFASPKINKNSERHKSEQLISISIVEGEVCEWKSVGNCEKLTVRLLQGLGKLNLKRTSVICYLLIKKSYLRLTKKMENSSIPRCDCQEGSDNLHNP